MGTYTLRLSREELSYVRVALEFQLNHDDNTRPPWKAAGELALAKAMQATREGTGKETNANV